MAATLFLALGPASDVFGRCKPSALSTGCGPRLFAFRVRISYYLHGCPCGFHGDPTRECRCTPGIIQRYLAKISGPMRLPTPTTSGSGVETARQKQRERGFYNAPIPSAQRRTHGALDETGERMAGPRGVRRGASIDKGRVPLGRRGMNSGQNDPGLRQWAAAPHCNLPAVLIERQHDACGGLREIQQGDVACSGEIRAGPPNVVATGSQRLYDHGEDVALRVARCQEFQGSTRRQDPSRGSPASQPGCWGQRRRALPVR